MILPQVESHLGARRTLAGAPSKELLPGFEPGSLDSKSRVITITLQKLLDTQKVVIVGLEPTTLGLLDPCSTI